MEKNILNYGRRVKLLSDKFGPQDVEKVTNDILQIFCPFFNQQFVNAMVFVINHYINKFMKSDADVCSNHIFTVHLESIVHGIYIVSDVLMLIRMFASVLTASRSNTQIRISKVT